MFSSASTKVIKDNHDATYQNILLVLGAEKGEFVSDPYFGMRLKRYMFDQNNSVLKDIIIDEIYTQLKTFMPQLTINRSDITIDVGRAMITCHIKAVNKLDYTCDAYDVVLLRGEGE
jgi:phage baseplate assembly protein W